jgi:hypothetical protein
MRPGQLPAAKPKPRASSRRPGCSEAPTPPGPPPPPPPPPPPRPPPSPSPAPRCAPYYLTSHLEVSDHVGVLQPRQRGDLPQDAAVAAGAAAGLQLDLLDGVLAAVEAVDGGDDDAEATAAEAVQLLRAPGEGARAGRGVARVRGCVCVCVLRQGSAACGRRGGTAHAAGAEAAADLRREPGSGARAWNQPPRTGCPPRPAPPAPTWKSER